MTSSQGPRCSALCRGLNPIIGSVSYKARKTVLESLVSQVRTCFLTKPPSLLLWPPEAGLPWTT